MTSGRGSNSTTAYVDAAIPRLIARVQFYEHELHLTHTDAIARTRAESVAGPAVWAQIERELNR